LTLGRLDVPSAATAQGGAVIIDGTAMENDDEGPMDQFSAHLDRGWDLVTRGDFAGAMISARKGLEIDAESPEAHNLLGFILAAEGNPEEALDHYRQAIESDETFIEAMLNAAEVLIHPLGDFDGALEMVEDALDYCETPDEVADAMLLKLDVLLHMGERERAAELLDALPEGPFEGPGIEFLIGRARHDLGDLDGAEPRIRRAVEQDPDNADARYYLALIQEARGNPREATLEFLRTRELDLQAPPPPWSLPSDQFERKVEAAVHRLAPTVAQMLDGTLVMVVDMPGAEVVADGVDPRVPLLMEDVTGTGPDLRVGRLFVYQRNVERVCPEILALEDEILRGLEHELSVLAEQPATPDAGGEAPEPPTEGP
jgi:tetratricopeptide (TPR) repeat protein